MTIRKKGGIRRKCDVFENPYGITWANPIDYNEFPISQGIRAESKTPLRIEEGFLLVVSNSNL